MISHLLESLTASRRRRWWALAGALILAFLVALGFRLGPIWLVSDGSLKTLAALSVLVVPLWLVLGVSKIKVTSPKKIVFRLALLLWWYLLVSDSLFDRISDVRGTYQGQYSIDAYGEAATWATAFLALVRITLVQNTYLLDLFSGSYKWLSFFVISCMIAVTYSPSPPYSAGWCFKLLVVVLVLRLCTSCMEHLKDIHAFLWANFWGLLVAAVIPLAAAFYDPTRLFQGVGGRLNADPVVLSITSSCLVIVTLTLRTLRRSLWLTLVTAVSLLTMILALGKTGLIAGLLSGMLFFLLQRKLASGAGLLAGAVVMGAILLQTVTPLGNYLNSYRAGSTLTGRTEIWRLAIKKIEQQPLVGHGYLASKFMWVTSNGPYAEAGHLHNGFLEVFYNNGLIGLVLLLAMHVAILKNLLSARSIISAAQLETPNDFWRASALIAGVIALYVDLLINGLFTPAFGGRPTTHFMMFLAVLGTSVALRRCTNCNEGELGVAVSSDRKPSERFVSPAHIWARPASGSEHN